MTKFLFCTAALSALMLSLPAAAHSGPDHDKSTSDESAGNKKSKSQQTGAGQPPHSPVSAYKPDGMLGWKLHVHEDLIADTDLHKKLMAELHCQLYLCEVSLPAEKVELLKKVPIWIELKNPYHGGAQYHPSKEWLSKNGYLPEKAKCVEISNAKGFANRRAYHKANTMLHEFAHAYHDLHLEFDQPDVLGAYNKIIEAGTYDAVLHVDGKTKRHYALTDHKEYFAECTEAFFGANDHFPFVRPELKNVDPLAHDLVKELWGVKEEKKKD